MEKSFLKVQFYFVCELNSLSNQFAGIHFQHSTFAKKIHSNFLTDQIRPPEGTDLEKCHCNDISNSYVCLYKIVPYQKWPCNIVIIWSKIPYHNSVEKENV